MIDVETAPSPAVQLVQAPGPNVQFIAAPQPHVHYTEQPAVAPQVQVVPAAQVAPVIVSDIRKYFICNIPIFTS